MKLPSILKLSLLATGAYMLLRLCGRVRRLELVTGAWRTQVDGLTWYDTDEYDEALRSWERELRDEAA